MISGYENLARAANVLNRVRADVLNWWTARCRFSRRGLRAGKDITAA